MLYSHEQLRACAVPIHPEPAALTAEVYGTLGEVPAGDWDTVAPRGRVGLERSHLLAVERAGLNDLEPWYVVGRAGGHSRGIGHFFLFDMDFARMGTGIPPWVRETLRVWYPDFLHLRVAECGLLAGLGEGIAARPGDLEAMVGLTARELERVATPRGAQVAILRDVPLGHRDAYRPLEDQGWIPVPGFPRAELALPEGGFDGYLRALKYKKRNTLERNLRRLEVPGVEVRTLDRFGHLADELYALWHQIHHRASDYEHEVLSPAYFREIDAALPERSYLTAITRHDELIGYFLNFVGDEVQFSAHCGLDYRHNREHAVYFNLYTASIREAARRGSRAVDFGITTYDVKLALGCHTEPLLYYVKHLAEPDLTRGFAEMLRKSIAQPESRHRPWRVQPAPLAPSPARVSRDLDEDVHGPRTDVFRRVNAYSRMDLLRLVELYSFFPPFQGAQEPVVRHAGRRVIMLGTNAYLGLSTHPALLEAAHEALDHYGTGSTGSPLLNGTMDLHVDLTRELAAFMEQEDAALFSTGYQTNLGVVGALVNWNDVVIMDERNHASLIDGAVQSRAKIVRYPHNDIAALGAALEQHRGRAMLVIVDGIFSMEGTLARLPEIVALARAHGARVMVDEAHAVGVMGPGGRGVCEHFGLLDQVDVLVGTFSKSFSACGGFVAGSRQLVDVLRHKARSHVFSASLPPSTVATVRAALEVFQAEPERRRAVLDNAAYLARGLAELGFETAVHGTPIVPVRCGDELLTLGLYRALLDRGVFVNPVLSPAVPKGEEQLRVSVMATHTTSHLDEALEVFASVRTPHFPLPEA